MASRNLNTGLPGVDQAIATLKRHGIIVTPCYSYGGYNWYNQGTGLSETCLTTFEVISRARALMKKMDLNEQGPQ